METNRARTTLDMKTPQALGRCDSNPRPVPRQSEESRSFCGTCPPKSVRSWRLLFGCLTVFDLNEGTGRMAPGNRRYSHENLARDSADRQERKVVTIERAAVEYPSPPGCRRWRGRAGGSPPCAQIIL